MRHKKGFFSRENIQSCLSDDANKDSLAFDFLILGVILVSCIIFVIQTFNLTTKWDSFLLYIDFVLNILFCVEFIMRILFSTDLKKHFKSTYTYVDLIAISPFLLGVGTSFIFFRAFRFFRVFRFFRFFRYSGKYMNLKDYHSNYLEKIFVIKILFTIFLFMYVASALVYQFEFGVNPNINSFGDAIYFMVISATTVGYGDIAPVTHIGKIITMLSVLGALIIIPWHIGSLIKYLSISTLKQNLDFEESVGNEIVDRFKKIDKNDNIACPHCKRKFD